jgi:hypothetical protein
VSWLAWGSLHLLRPLAVALRPRLALRGCIDDGVPVEGARDTVTFRANHTGELRLGSVYPGELQADGPRAVPNRGPGASAPTWFGTPTAS